MGNILRPTGAMIWVSIFICLCLIGQSAATVPATTDPLGKIKDFHSNFISHDQQSEPSLAPGQLSNREPGVGIFHPDLMTHSSPVNEHIAMDNSHPEQQVQNIYALNTNIKRDIVFDDTQSGDPKEEGLKNSMNIAINGNGQTPSKDNTWIDSESDDNGIENMVDNAMVSKQHGDPVNYQSHSGSPEQQRLGNYLNIAVSGINVQAINTVENGNAVATSNIEIKPIQIINCPPEVEEKLK